jgi:pimeloyl-ACP methyl ester carboxylesterase
MMAGRYFPWAVTLSAVGACGGLLLTVCGDEASSADTSSSGSSTRAAPEQNLDRVVRIDGIRGLYVKCTGSGSPTVLMEGGDEDTSESYAFAVPSISEAARTCVYDRANLGRSEPAAGPRELSDLVGDFEALLQAAEIPGPYVLVGTSGGGYISAGYPYEHLTRSPAWSSSRSALRSAIRLE